MSNTNTQIPSYVHLIIAGLSGGGASVLTHPIDIVKYQMQLSGKGGTAKLYRTSMHAFNAILQKEGIRGIYTGFTACLLRQMTLTTTRLGLFSAILDKFTAADGTPPSVQFQLLAGTFSGALGAATGNPADVALVRMASDRAYPPEQRYNYKNAFHAIITITREEGYSTLWTGWKPSVFRCMVLNITQLVLYKNTKHILLKTGYFDDDFILSAICSTTSAMVSTVATAPIDIAKTRLMTMKEGKPEYFDTSDVWKQMIKKEGFFSLWKGVTPTFLRTLPNNIVVFFLLEFLTRTYKKFFLNNHTGAGF